MLKSVRVLSFTHFLQGPMAAQNLGDFGADVIKVEPLSGAYERQWSGLDARLNGVSINFLLANRNERSISIDLKQEAGRQIAQKLVCSADVLIENYRPGVMERLGLGYESVRARNPSIVYCSCSGYGSSGPYLDRPGQDLLAQAVSGLMTLSGGKNDPPMPVGAPVVDLHGATLATTAILAALLWRKKTGQGKKIECSLLDAALDLQIEPFNIHLNGFPLYDKSASGISSRFGQAPYGVFQTCDGYLCLSMIPLNQLAEVFGDPSFLQWVEEGQFARREEINQKVAQHMAAHTNQFWQQRFDAAGIWYSQIDTYAQVEQNPQVEWNECIVTLEHQVAGTIRLLGNPIRFDGRRPEITKAPPMVGEQTEEILRELGYTAQEIHTLETQSVVRTCAGAVERELM